VIQVFTLGLSVDSVDAISQVTCFLGLVLLYYAS
jgi:hypothetical protein